jgi:hypothetical protein
MNAYEQLIQELTGDIEKSVHSGDWNSVGADLSALCMALVGALVERRDPDIRIAYDRVEKLYSVLAAHFWPLKSRMDAETTTAELQAYTRLLAIALEHRVAPDQRTTAYEGTNRKILCTLLKELNGLSGRDLAAKVQVAPETIARKLPELRAAQLIESWKAGKATINTLTQAGQDLAKALQVFTREPTTVAVRNAVGNNGRQVPRRNPEIAMSETGAEVIPLMAA